jgi:NAD(P)-dependent dehydrogenase (short-subunit alcohol dehydrogenase family)
MNSDKTNVLITGGSSGIGLELVKYLDKKKYNILICSRSKKKLNVIMNQHKNVKIFRCDVSNEGQVKKLYQYSKKKFKKIDVIINAAGIYGSIGKIEETKFNEWKKAIEINFFGTYLICKYFINFLRSSKIKKIVNFSGGGAFNSFPNYSSYASSKAALVRFSETLASELKKEKISVNCIAPGFVATPLHKATIAAGKKKAGKKFLNFTKKKLRNGSVPIELPVKCVEFLISKKSKNLTGKTISASFDRWHSKKFQMKISDYNKSDVFTMRRINL